MNEDGGAWVKEQALDNGVKIFDNTKINSFSREGMFEVEKKKKDMTLLLMLLALGQKKIISGNNIKTKYSLELIRGSHLLIDNKISNPFIFRRTFWKENSFFYLVRKHFDRNNRSKA